MKGKSLFQQFMRKANYTYTWKKNNLETIIYAT
jgi:hypothetical protein